MTSAELSWRKLTGIGVGGTDRDHIGADGHVLEDFVGVAHRVVNWGIVVEIDHVAVHGQRAGQARVAVVLGLHHQNVVLYLGFSWS